MRAEGKKKEKEPSPDRIIKTDNGKAIERERERERRM